MPLFSVRRNVVQRLLVCLALLAAARCTAGDSWKDYTNNRTIYDDQIRDIQARRAEMDRRSSSSYSSGSSVDRARDMYRAERQRKMMEYWEAGERRMRGDGVELLGLDGVGGGFVAGGGERLLDAGEGCDGVGVGFGVELGDAEFVAGVEVVGFEAEDFAVVGDGGGVVVGFEGGGGVGVEGAGGAWIGAGGAGVEAEGAGIALQDFEAVVAFEVAALDEQAGVVGCEGERAVGGGEGLGEHVVAGEEIHAVGRAFLDDQGFGEGEVGLRVVGVELDGEAGVVERGGKFGGVGGFACGVGGIIGAGGAKAGAGDVRAAQIRAFVDGEVGAG